MATAAVPKEDSNEYQKLHFLLPADLGLCWLRPFHRNRTLGYIEIREVTVGPTLAKCYGVGLQSCMVVDGGLFYDGIEGFEYEAGYDYRLRIGKYDPWDGEETAAGTPVCTPTACWSNWRRPRHHPPPPPCRWGRRGCYAPRMTTSVWWWTARRTTT